MGVVREHQPIIVEELFGIWARGDMESCPADHLILADDVNFIHSGLRTRTACEPLLSFPFFDTNPGVPPTFDFRRVLRHYTYTTQTTQGIIAMTEEVPVLGNPPMRGVYHITQYNPLQWKKIGSFNGNNVDDFAMIVIAGRAYISPFKYFVDSEGKHYGLGSPGESVYVYQPSMATMRKAAGPAPTNAGKKPLIAYENELAGKVTEGYHAYSVSFNDGAIEMSLRPTAFSSGGKTVRLDNIPIGPAGTTSRTLTMTKAGIPFQSGVANTLYKVTTIPDNTTTTFVIDISDEELTTVYTPGANPGPPIDAMMVFNVNKPGFCDTGFHLFGVVYETDTGYLSAIGPETFTGQTLVDSTKKCGAINIPTGPANTVKRHLVATKEIIDYKGDQKGYQFFFIPKATIEDNTTTTLEFDFYDADLISDASHLIDNYSSIPACVNFTLYHGRLVMVGDSTYPEKKDGSPDTSKPDNRSVARLSAPGEPEAVSKVDGLIVTPLDGHSLTNCKAFRDVLYLFKQTRTYAYSDNEDEPATWIEEALDQGVGTCIHGIAEVLDSGGVNIDFLIIADYSGLMLFNGTYARPELSWKVENIWQSWDRRYYHRFQIVNDSIGKKLWILPSDSINMLYHIDYGNGLDPKGVRWSRWNFSTVITSLALVQTNLLTLGAYQSVSAGPFRDPKYFRPEGRAIYEDEIDPFPPAFPDENSAGGIIVGKRDDTSKHDVFYNASGTKFNIPIRARIRTAFLGD